MIHEYAEAKVRLVELPRFRAASAEEAELVFQDETVWTLDRADLGYLIDTLTYCLEQMEVPGV